MNTTNDSTLSGTLDRLALAHELVESAYRAYVTAEADRTAAARAARDAGATWAVIGLRCGTNAGGGHRIGTRAA